MLVEIRIYAQFGSIHHQRLRKVLIFLARTVGYGEIIGIKPAKKLLEEQKAHLMGKTEQ